MNQFSIKDIEALTGIKSHTLRIWEQRYQIVEPQRTPTNIRYYTNDDVKLLLNVAFLNRLGLKISKISKFSQEQISDLIHKHVINGDGQDYKINLLMSCMLNLDESGFTSILDRNVNERGLQRTMEELVFPFFGHIGILWQAGTVNPGFEHFITHIVKSKIIHATAELGNTQKRKDCKKFVLWLPDGETHEVGLLFANFLIRREGHESIYLGQNMPCCDLRVVIKSYDAPYLFTSLIMSPYFSDSTKLILDLSRDFNDKKILLTGQGFLKVDEDILPDNVYPIRNCADFLHFLA